MNYCQTCGSVRHPVAKPGNCKECHFKIKRELFIQEWNNKLDYLGFDVITINLIKGAHSKVEVKNRTCGHTFTAKLNNILSGMTKCGICGPKMRTKKATEKYIKMFGRDYDISEWKGYLLEVRALSNITYDRHKNILNPMGLPRCKPSKHPDAVNLDHIIPIIEGFKKKIPTYLMADIRNLRIIPAKANLRKKQKLTEEAEKLLEVLNKKL